MGEGPLLVVLHGGPGAHHDYLLPQYDRLATGRTFLYYDQRGGGRSPVSRETPLGWREHVADLEALRRHLGLEQLTLLGYSWGGLLAVLYLLEHPGKVARLALVSPAAITAQWRDESERRFAARTADPAIVEARAALSASGLRERDPDAFWREAFALSVAGYFRDPAEAKKMTPFRVNARTQQAVWDSLGDYDLRSRLRQHPSRFPLPPSLVVHGTFDPIPIESSRELAALLHAELIELPCGHAPHVEATDEFVRALDAFLPRA